MFWNSGKPSHKSADSKQSNFKSWILILTIGLGFAILLLQSSAGLSPATNKVVTSESQSVPEPTEDSEPAAGTGLFMDEYEPDALPFLDTDSQSADIKSTEKPMWLTIVDLAIKLILVIGLLYATLLGIRWLQKHRGAKLEDGSTAVRVLETVGLTPGRSLYLVAVGEKTLLIGATDHQLSLLTELSDVTVSLPEEESEFEAVLHRQSEPVAQDIDTLQPDDDSLSETQAEDWRAAIDNLRSGVKDLRKSVDKVPQP